MIVDTKDKELLVETLTERLLSTHELEKKERILSLLQRMKRRSNSGFQNRSEVAEQFGISCRKLMRDIKANKAMVDELSDAGWVKKKSGFYPRQIAIIKKHLGQ